MLFRPENVALDPKNISAFTNISMSSSNKLCLVFRNSQALPVAAEQKNLTAEY
jgi:hypothetical protein